METIKKIVYDETTAGRRIITIPTEMVFSPYLDELAKIQDHDKRRKSLSALVEGRNLYEIAAELTSYLVIAEHPHLELLTILSMAASGDPAGIRLLYSSVLAVQPASVMIGRMADFTIWAG